MFTTLGILLLGATPCTKDFSWKAAVSETRLFTEAEITAANEFCSCAVYEVFQVEPKKNSVLYKLGIAFYMAVQSQNFLAALYIYEALEALKATGFTPF